MSLEQENLNLRNMLKVRTCQICFDPKGEITLKGKCLLATKSNINGLVASNSFVYALVCKDVLISLHDVQHSLPPTAVNILQEYTDVFPSEVPQGLPPTLRDRAPD